MNKVTDNSVDLSGFAGKMPWDKRVAIIRSTFPSTERLDWIQVFKQDPTVLGKILNDIIKHDQAEPGRPGKRPALNVKAAEQSLLRYRNDDYSVLPFRESFILLKGTRSIRHMATMCGLTSTMVQRILENRADPTMEMMEKIAAGFKKDPSFFAEYRSNYVLSVLADRMDSIPEASIVQYKKLKQLKDDVRGTY